jgi:pilus assembly protein FimV
LRVLADDAKKADGEAADEAAGEEAQPEVDAEPEDSAATAMPGLKAVQNEGEAELLDEDSSDPEIQLDLARAYISMGDKEAARVILEEVVGNGTEEQQAEARKMLGIL